MIWRVVYISRRGVTDDALVDLLTEARDRNAIEDITGVLLADRFHFVQAVEGARPAIADLALRLMADPRHSDLRVLASGPDEVRWFSNWNMTLRMPGRRGGSLKRRFGNADFPGQAALFEALMEAVETSRTVEAGVAPTGEP